MSVVVIGAGISGIQFGYYLEKYKINYIILEKESNLDNILKKNIFNETYSNTFTSNEEDNYSLLCDEIHKINFKKYYNLNFTDYYDYRKSYIDYLNDYITNYNLKIIFNTKVLKITKNINNEFNILTDKKIYKALRIIVASGKNKINIPKNLNYFGKTNLTHILSFMKNDLLSIGKNKNILIIGNENNIIDKIKLLTSNYNNLIILSKNVQINKIKNYRTKIIDFEYDYIKIIEKNNKFYVIEGNEIINFCKIDSYDKVFFNTELFFNGDIFVTKFHILCTNIHL